MIYLFLYTSTITVINSCKSVQIHIMYVLQINKNRKSEPVWSFLEREMKANAEKVPYNDLVGEWLVFLKDLKRHYRREKQRELERLTKSCGPKWFIELSSLQRDTLDGLKNYIHRDLIAGQVTNVKTALANLGVTKRIKKETLMKAMVTCLEDPGVFIWQLYTDIYKVPPCILRPCK